MLLSVSICVEHPIIFARKRMKPFRSGPIYNSVPTRGNPHCTTGRLHQSDPDLVARTQLSSVEQDGTLRGHLGLQILPERHQEFACQGNDADPSHTFARMCEALFIPAA